MSNAERKKRPLGKSNLELATEAGMSILKALSDESWHKYKEILEETEISSRTLTKHLKRLEKCKLIQKERKKYPFVYYKAEPELVTWTEAIVSMEELSQKIEPVLLETKDPLLVLSLIEMYCRGNLALTFFKIKEDTKVPDYKLRFLLDLFVWEPYRVLTWKLVEASKKHMNEINLEKNLMKRLEKLKEKIEKSGA